MGRKIWSCVVHVLAREENTDIEAQLSRMALMQIRWRGLAAHRVDITARVVSSARIRLIGGDASDRRSTASRELLDHMIRIDVALRAAMPTKATDLNEVGCTGR